MTPATTVSGSLGTVTQPIRAFLDEPRVIEIMLNPDGRIWVDRAGEGMSLTDTVMTPRQAEDFLRFVAAESEATLTRDTPTLAGTLPHWDARVQGWMPPVVAKPAFALRKPAPVIFTLDDYVTRGVLTPEQRSALIGAVLDRKNILIGGGTGTGKTTFANALLAVVAERTQDRLYIAEDRPELQCRAPNALFVRTVRDIYSMHGAIFDSLRGRPDRIIVGELRDGGTALELMKGWATGHPGGVATIHANDCPGMLTRFCWLVQEVVQEPPRAFVAEAIDICVHLTLDVRSPAGRRLSGLATVHGYDPIQQRWELEPLL